MFNYENCQSTFSILNYFCGEFKVPENLPFHENIVKTYSWGLVNPSSEMINIVSHKVDLDLLVDNEKPHRTLGLEMEFFPFDLKLFAFQYRNFLTTSHIYDFCLQITQGVLFLYQQKIVHLDLKLDNLLVSPCLHVVICDFGCAKPCDENFICYLDPNEAPGGNREHLAIEILNCNNFNKGRKIMDYTYQPSFALGVLFYELATGLSAFAQYPAGKNPNYNIPEVDFSPLNKFDYRFVELIKKLICPHPRPLPEEILHIIQEIVGSHQ